MINSFFTLYGITKNGMINGTNKKCACGEETTGNVCPRCGADLSKSKLLNVAKNTALAKKESGEKVGNVLSYKITHLLSTGFELYEQTMLEFSVDLDSEEVKISNTTMFKRMSDAAGVFGFLDEQLPGFTAMAYEIIAKGAQFSRLVSMSEAQYSNILHVYLNYRALYPYLLKYKILYFGNLLNLKKYYPGVDFNDPAQVNSIGLNLGLLSFWDIKNVKYVETIIDISKQTSIQADLADMLVECQKELADCLRDYNFDGNWALDTFGLLFNKEISAEDFVRIFKRSHPREFFQMKKYKTMYKKVYRKELDWSTVRGLTKKDIASMKMKEAIKANKRSAEEIDTMFKTLESDPIAVLKMFT